MPSSLDVKTERHPDWIRQRWVEYSHGQALRQEDVVPKWGRLNIGCRAPLVHLKPDWIGALGLRASSSPDLAEKARKLISVRRETQGLNVSRVILTRLLQP
jgi:hypothetical protein